MNLIHGDCYNHLLGMAANSIDSLVTDPPAGISFMGKEWDSNKGGRDQWIEWLTDVMRACLYIMKPGAHGLVWAIPRTSHWTATALENAGFEIRDVVTHLFGTGFPKSLDISKAIDKAAGAKRDKIGVNPNHRSMKGTTTHGDEFQPHTSDGSITTPSTSLAKQWFGWGTALKPASEHWILVRKPISEKTVAANIAKWGTGGINIDGCRIESADQSALAKNWDRTQSATNKNGTITREGGDLKPIDLRDRVPTGRFPANLVLDEEAAAMLDEQSGELGSGGSKSNCQTSELHKWIGTNNDRIKDSGGASRFFYVAKASRAERNAGLEGMPEKKSSKMGDGIQSNVGNGAPGKTESGDRKAANFHPTVKSLKLMQYLCRLITPPGGTVLDPFMGSGSTGVAAKADGFKFIGIEREAEYFAIAKGRIA